VPLRVVPASAVAAAASERGFTGGGITALLGDNNSAVVNILSLAAGEPAFELAPPRGLFVMASRTALRGGVLARCAMIVLVLDLAVAVVLELRIFARELAVGANNLDVVLVGLKMDALLLLLSLLLLLLLLLSLVSSAAISAAAGLSPGTRLVDVNEREVPTPPFVPINNAVLTEEARTL
jgi:hypothetical protein